MTVLSFPESVDTRVRALVFIEVLTLTVHL